MPSAGGDLSKEEAWRGEGAGGMSVGMGGHFFLFGAEFATKSSCVSYRERCKARKLKLQHLLCHVKDVKEFGGHSCLKACCPCVCSLSPQTGSCCALKLQDACSLRLLRKSQRASLSVHKECMLGLKCCGLT